MQELESNVKFSEVKITITRKDEEQGEETKEEIENGKCS